MNKTLYLVLVYFALPISILAQTKDLDIKLTVQKVVVSQGKETLQPAEKARPDEIVQYTAVYTNQSNGMLRNLEPTLPIPVGMEYQAGSAKPNPQFASIDGRSYAAIPLKRKVKNAQGQEVEREVPATEYRGLRWRIGNLDSHKSVTVEARAKVTSNRPVALK